MKRAKLYDTWIQMKNLFWKGTLWWKVKPLTDFHFFFGKERKQSIIVVFLVFHQKLRANKSELSENLEFA